jgi:hypothetical protein
MKATLRRLLAAVTHSGPGYDLPPLPRRGDPVEAWLKERCDALLDGNLAPWNAVAAILDDYQLHADTGTPLDQPLGEVAR